MTNALQNLTPDMQARLAQIMAGAQQPAQPQIPNPAQSQQFTPTAPLAPPVAQQQPATLTKPPSLIDHVIALRQENAALREAVTGLLQQTAASAQVLDAIGHAVGRMYQMFQPTEHASQNPTYSQNFQQQQQQDIEEAGDY